jgi:hypothetical protein
MPCTTRVGSGSGMHVASPPYSKARNSGESSSHPPSRFVRGLGAGRAEKSGARNGFASCRAMTVLGTTPRGDADANGAVGETTGVGSGSGSRPAARSRSFFRSMAADDTTAPSVSSSSSEVSRAAVFARIVAMPSRRVSIAVRSDSLMVVSALTRARSSRTSSATTW